MRYSENMSLLACLSSTIQQVSDKSFEWLGSGVILPPRFFRPQKPGSRSLLRIPPTVEVPTTSWDGAVPSRAKVDVDFGDLDGQRSDALKIRRRKQKKKVIQAVLAMVHIPP